MEKFINEVIEKNDMRNDSKIKWYDIEDYEQEIDESDEFDEIEYN